MAAPLYGAFVDVPATVTLSEPLTFTVAVSPDTVPASYVRPLVSMVAPLAVRPDFMAAIPSLSALAAAAFDVHRYELMSPPVNTAVMKPLAASAGLPAAAPPPVVPPVVLPPVLPEPELVLAPP